MPQETNSNSIFASPCKNMRGLKALVSNNEAPYSFTDEIIDDYELAQRKAEEAASRRYQATEWLRQMDYGASESLPKEPSEEEFCLALRNGLIFCNVLNKVSPGSVPKVVENPIIAVQSIEGAAQSAIQYFENMRNFLEAVKNMKLLTFEASDLEKGGSSNKVVDCILCLKGYYEWKQAGGIGVWRYGGTVKITSFPKESAASLVGSESTDESLDESESSQYEQLLEFLHFSSEISLDESRTSNVLSFLFDRFSLGLISAYLRENSELEDWPLNAMVMDTLLRRVVKDFSAQLVSQGTQLGIFLKKILKGGCNTLSKSEFLEVISQYLSQRSNLVSSDLSKFCTCGGKTEVFQHIISHSSDHTQRIDIQHKQLLELKSYFLETRLDVKNALRNWEEEFRRLDHHMKDIEVASTSYHQVLEENRLLYNQVQDLKGTIRVFCRVRPFLPGQSNGESTVDYIGENGNMMIVNPLKQGKGSRRMFSFNKVFGVSVTQEQIYIDTQPLIRSVLDGYNVCIFAYGQTGSGKTYTMSGPDINTEETWGVNYRSLRDLFQISKSRADVVRYEIAVQMIEIYNEQVRDLLVSDGSTRRLDIRNNSQSNGINVPDASLVPVTCTHDVLDLMRIGHKNRAVGATALNERSSRSHSVLTIHVHGKELVSGSILRGCLHLVDLAGSERVDKSEAVGERLREAQHINRSLSALGDVISALAQKSQHIPYRNSKLTQVLQDSLGGHAKTLMFVHINPEVNALGETISTLKFAERVASIELGAARSNKETGEIKELKEEISNLKLALGKKEAELEHYKGGNSKNTLDSQKVRAVSPFRIPKHGLNTKSEASQGPLDEVKVSEVRSCSSGKQRRSRFPSAFTEKETFPKMPCLFEERSASSGKRRSPSPPIRGSLSTDRGALIKSRTKLETIDHQPIAKVPFPARIPVNKSCSSTSVISSTDNNNTRVFFNLQDPTEHDSISDSLYNLQMVSSRKKVHLDQEDHEQFKQALNVREGGIRKSKAEIKAKAKQTQVLPRGDQKSEVTTTLISDFDVGENIEEARKSDFSEPENEQFPHFPVAASVHSGAFKVKKLQQKFPRNGQILEPRGLVPAVEPIHENKLPNVGLRYPKEGSNVSIAELRRSRSTPRGKYFMLP